MTSPLDLGVPMGKAIRRCLGCGKDLEFDAGIYLLLEGKPMGPEVRLCNQCGKDGSDASAQSNERDLTFAEHAKITGEVLDPRD